jgi:AraC-like DNA-binding protein
VADITPAVSMRLVWAILSAARLGNVRDEGWLAHAGLGGLDLSDPELRVPARQVATLWCEAARASNDARIGFRAGSLLQSGAFGAIDYAARCGSTLREFYERLARFHRLIGDGCDICLVERGDSVRVVLDWPGENAESRRHMAEFAAAGLVALGREAAGSRFSVAHLAFRHRRSEGAEELQAWFGAPPGFGEPTSHFLLARRVLDLPLLRAEPGLAAVLDGLAEALLARLPEPDDLLLRVRYAISNQLWTGECALESVARALCMSARSLQRRLQDRGTSFNLLVDTARREAALELVLDPSITVSDIAVRVGFSEPSAFDRAFRRWTGSSPSHYRRSRELLSQPPKLSS